MAVTAARAFHPRLPKLGDLDPSRVAFDYDRVSDTLFVYFSGKPEAAISVVAGDYLLYRVHPETEEVLGLQVDDFLTAAVSEIPALLDVIGLGDLGEEEIEAMRAKVSVRAWKRTALAALLGELAAGANELTQKPA